MLLKATVQYLRENTDYEIEPFLAAEPCMKLLNKYGTRNAHRGSASGDDGQNSGTFNEGVLPSCIISDIQIEDQMSGLEFLEYVRDHPIENVKGLPFVLLTARGMTDDRIAGYQKGANAYLPKPFSPEELKAILIGLVSRNLASASSSAAATSSLDGFAPPPPPTSSVTLSPRESEVLKLLSLGLTNKEMSSNMFVSVRTVERYVSDLFKKTGTGRRTELVRWALKYGFVDVDESG
ncbi:hypothetical protein TrCOL_g11963 [Triparma columacea]|uniref:Uncharacterized protein n=1 Tax=Triparma columacea TaxID=722753 RepID=A0A9W7L0N8_9STRA|nr:hypothetical protein TrCOL_g11963 [Triparma columacea]